MKAIGEWIGLLAVVLVLGFVSLWWFMPDKKQDIQDWWYGMTIDCVQMQREVINDQLCKTSDDCELVRKEAIRAKKLEAHYSRYCGSL